MSNLENFGRIKNPVTGIFGTGQVKYYYQSGNFVVPTGISSVRVRLWGAGGTNSGTNSPGMASGGGGGFALKTISGLTSGSSISVTVGTSASASSSFGAYVSATGGTTATSGAGGAGASGGSGVGGDINNTGGTGGAATFNTNSSYFFGGGAGCAGLLGKGGDGNVTTYGRPDATFVGGATGASNMFVNTQFPSNPQPVYGDINRSEEFDIYNLDLIGTGRGPFGGEYATSTVPFNGGGGGKNYKASIPGGSSHNSFGQGLVIVEY